MELDEFKAYWNNMQEKEIEKQKLTTETLNKMTAKIVDTLEGIQKKNVILGTMGKTMSSCLIIIGLVKLCYLCFFSIHDRLFMLSLLHTCFTVGFSIYLIWFYKRVMHIFDINTNE